MSVDLDSGLGTPDKHQPLRADCPVELLRELADVAVVDEFLGLPAQLLEVLLGATDHIVGCVSHHEVGLLIVVSRAFLHRNVFAHLEVVVEPLVDVGVAGLLASIELELLLKLLEDFPGV